MTDSIMARPSLLELAERVEEGKTSDNALDVLVEIALFKPWDNVTAIRANAAGTKVIYTVGGVGRSYRAGDWTMDVERYRTAEKLRARAAQEVHHDQ